MSNRNFDHRVIIQRLQNQNYARNLYQNNTTGQKLINNPQNSDGNASRYNSYVPGAQTEYFRGLVGAGETVSVGGIVNIPPFPSVPTTTPVPVTYDFVTNGLTLYYNFGDSASYPGSGITVTDLSPSGFNGTLVNSPEFFSTNGGVLVFDGVNDYINTNNSIASNSFTINAWFKATTNVSVPRMLISKESPPGTPWNYRLYLNSSNGNLIGDIAQVADSASIGYSQNLADNTWHLASFSRDETTDKLKLYVDGVLVTELTAGLTGSITNPQNVWIGRSAFDPALQGGSYPFIGNLGSAFIYNRALTDDEVFTNFMATKTRFEPLIPSVTETFTTTGTTSWIAPTGVTSVQYLVVGAGGGGGGGYDTGGGGGGGGGMVLKGTLSVTPGSTYTVTVGAGGAASTNSYPGTPETAGGIGGNSVFGSITALGGEGGKGSRTQTGASGRGGAAAINPSTASVGGSGGGSGGTAVGGSGGGGGGSSGQGSNGVTGTGGAGGTGTSSIISGSSITYGIGGNGARGQAQITGANGTANRGNGGGGGAFTSGGARNGGAGGSGIVIITY